jgi:hypothetical protein
LLKVANVHGEAQECQNNNQADRDQNEDCAIFLLWDCDELFAQTQKCSAEAPPDWRIDESA